jgi:hypothetical protein
MYMHIYIQVGVDVNTASPSLLKYIAGLTEKVAQNLVKYREENVSMCVCACAHVCMCTCRRVCVYVCMCIYWCVYRYREEGIM